MRWNRKIKAVICLKDLDLDKGKYQNPLLGNYQSQLFKPTANIDGYLTSCLVQTENDGLIELEQPIIAIVTFTSGDFELSVQKEYLLQMGSRRIGTLKIIDVLA